jgi:hypothetical protein
VGELVKGVVTRSEKRHRNSPPGAAVALGPSWPWYSFDGSLLGALRTSRHKPTVSAEIAGWGFIRALRVGPRKGERIRLVEIFVRPGGHLLLRVFSLAGPDWPARTVSRLREAHTVLDAGLASASALAAAAQHRAVIKAITDANAAIPPPVKPRRRRRKAAPPIQVVSGGLPSLGRR